MIDGLDYYYTISFKTKACGYVIISDATCKAEKEDNKLLSAGL